MQELSKKPVVSADSSGCPESAVSVLAVCPAEEDLAVIRTISTRRNWKLFEARNYRQALLTLCRHRMPVALCDARLTDGNWKDILSQIAPLQNPPRLIVISGDFDRALWSEVLNMGGFDMILKPLVLEELTRVVTSAARSWAAEWSSQPVYRSAMAASA